MPQHVTGAGRRRGESSLGGGLGGSIEGVAAPSGVTLRRPLLLRGALRRVPWAALALALALALGLALPAAAQAGGERAPLPPADVPAALRPPDGQVLLFRAFAQGTQVYECLPGGGPWTFRQPVATLVDDAGRDLGIHGRGPFWAAYDGSRVVGATQANAPARDPSQDVPLLLLRATANSGEGRFAAVNFIQRLDTRGGAAPAGPCDPAAGPILEVPYHAVYYFFGDRAAA